MTIHGIEHGAERRVVGAAAPGGVVRQFPRHDHEEEDDPGPPRMARAGREVGVAQAERPPHEHQDHEADDRDRGHQVGRPGERRGRRRDQGVGRGGNEEERARQRRSVRAPAPACSAPPLRCGHRCGRSLSRSRWRVFRRGEGGSPEPGASRPRPRPSAPGPGPGLPRCDAGSPAPPRSRARRSRPRR